QAGGKLFVSIHANSAPDRRAKGTETFFLGLHKTDAARRVMERENEVIFLEEDASAYEEYDARNAVLQTLTQSAYMRQSQALAEGIEDQFENRAGRSSRGVKQAGFYVLYGASMPSVLVELGFLSHPGEAAFMRSEDGQAYLASAIFRAIRTYKSEYDQGLHLQASNR
ncbi:MAG: N-acetylmuramoyl-L-alanine amidase, partial [Bacteroidota bacterium]|nr:N-acetylmuramoyl-L-alanine amidase [Bacteroidota bacterium]